MTAYELLDLSISIGNRIDLQLSVFITVHLAIFGGIVYVDRPLRSTEKVASLLLYSVFAALNLRIMQTQLGLDESIAREIGKLATDPCCITNEVVAFKVAELESNLHAVRGAVLWAGHIAFYVLVCLSILYDRALARRPAAQD